MNVIFVRPIFLWLLVSLPALVVTHFFVMRYLRRRALKFANFEAIKRVTGAEGNIRNTAIVSKNLPLLFLKLGILLMLILSAAEPVIEYTGKSSSFSYVIAIDASSSMLAKDFSPDRLGAAKEAAAFFIDTVSSRTDIGVVSFAGSSMIEQPVSNQLSAIKRSIVAIKPSSIGGTSLGDAIITSVNLLSSEEKSKIVILLSDGQSNVGATPEDGIDYANKNQIIVYTIGMGTEQGGSFIRTNLISRLDEETLKKISEKTGGKYFRATDKSTLVNAYKEISSYASQKMTLNLSSTFLIIVLVLLFLEWGLLNTVYRTLP